MKIKNTLCAIICLYFVSTNLYSQIKLDWANSFGNEEFDFGSMIELDNSGNIFVTGGFTGKIDFDPGPDSFYMKSLFSNWWQYFILKQDTSNNFKWAKKLDFTPTDMVSGANGNLYVIGSFGDTISLKIGTKTDTFISNGYTDALLLKLDKNGDVIWAKSFGGVSEDWPYDLEIDHDENIYISGLFYDSLDLDPGPLSDIKVSEGWLDIYFMKLDSLANYQWGISLGGDYQEGASDIALDYNGNIYLYGTFMDKVDFDPGSGKYNLFCWDQDPFLLKIDAKGDFVWVKQLEMSQTGESGRIEIDSKGNLLCSGEFDDEMDCDPSSAVHKLTTNGSRDIFILKFDSTANLIWAKQFGNKSWNTHNHFEIDNSDNVYLTGQFKDTFDFDPGNTKYNLISSKSNAFVLKLLDDGSFAWVRQIRSLRGSSRPYYIKTDNADNIYLTGDFRDTADFDPSYDTFLMSATDVYDDYFLTKWSPSSFTKGSFETTGCDSVILNSQVFYTSNEYAQVLKNHKDKDSVLLLKITILNNTRFDTSVSTCESFLWNGQSYNASGTILDTLVNYSGCDSIITLNLEIKDASDTIMQFISCNNVLINGINYDKSGSYKQTLSNYLGCDSILNLNIQIIENDTSITVKKDTLISNATNVTYQWLDCSNSFEAIAGANQQIFAPEKNGTYAVEIKSGDCIDTSGCVVIDLVSLNQLEFSNGLSIYPNPSFGEVYIKINNRNSKGGILLQIYDSKGGLIYHNNEATNGLKIVGLSHGIYYLKIIDNKAQAVRKLFVK